MKIITDQFQSQMDEGQSNQTYPLTPALSPKGARENHSRHSKIRNPQSTIRDGFTLVELLVVISIIALLAGLLVGGAMHAVNAMRRSRVEAERDALITAIEDYHKKRGVYPLDNTNDLTSVQTPLFYELTGTTAIMQGGIPTGFQSKVSQETLSTSPSGSGQINTLFGISGFLNCDNSENPAVNFYPGLKSAQHQIVTYPKTGGTFSVMGVQVSGPLQLNPANAGTGGTFINPWRYVSNHPTNNVDSFDLWIDVTYAGKTNRINNWTKDPQIVSY